MFQRQRIVGWSLLVLISSSSILSSVAYAYPPTEGQQQPHLEGGFVPARSPQLPSQRIDRKFAEKPNAMKKVALDDIDDIQTNQISDGGFSWSNMLGKNLLGKYMNIFIYSIYSSILNHCQTGVLLILFSLCRNDYANDFQRRRTTRAEQE